MSANNSYDIIVIGTGPAGSTFCRLISDKYKVLLIGKPDSKPCGGLLSPDAQYELARYNLTLPKDILVDPQVFAVKTIDLNSSRQRYYPRSYLNMDRTRFDNWLLTMIEPRVTIARAVCRDVIMSGEKYQVLYTENEEDKNAFATYVVDACGAGSFLRRKIFKKKIRKYLAIQQEFKSIEHSPFYSCIFDKNATDCCSWTISKDKKMIYGGAFSMKNAREKFEEQKKKMIEQGFMFAQELKLEACVVYRPSNPFQFTLEKNNVFAIGEAAGFISPSSLEGISYAMATGRLLAYAFNNCKKENKIKTIYKRKTTSLRMKIVLKLLKCPFMYNHFLRNLILKTGITSVNIEK